MTDSAPDYQTQADRAWGHKEYQELSFERGMMDRVIQIARQHGAKRMLSVGCGLGHGVKQLLDEGFDAYGVDVSQVALDRYPELKDRLVQADFTKVTEPLFGAVDMVYAVNVIQQIHPHDLDAFFKAIKAQQPERIYLVIDLTPDVFGKKVLDTDQNICHRPSHWWKETVGEHFDVRNLVESGTEMTLKICAISAVNGQSCGKPLARSLAKNENEKARERCYKKNVQALSYRGELSRIVSDLETEDADYAKAGLMVMHTPAGEPIPVLPVGEGHLAIDDNLDARAEALRWARALKIPNPETLTIMFGFGFGYAADEVLRLSGPRSHLLVIEPYLPVLKAAMEHRDLCKIFADARFHMMVGMEEVELLSHIDDLLGDNAQICASCLAMRTAYAALIGDDGAKFLRLAAIRFDRGCRSNKLCDDEHLDWARNNLCNLSWTLKYPGFEVFNDLPEMPAAICVGAGPTMANCVEFLRRMQDRVPIIACDITLPKLRACGIQPHLVAALDKSNNVLRACKKLDPTQTGLILHGQVNPAHANTEALFKIVAFELAWIKMLRDAYPRRTTTKWSFVGGMLISSAVDMGAKTLYLVGMDFAFTPELRTYCEGSNITDESIASYKRDEWIKVPGNVHDELPTAHSLHTFLSQTNDYIHFHQDLEIIPVTDGGARIANLEHVLPEDALKFADKYPITDWRSILKEHATTKYTQEHELAQRRVFRQKARDFLRYHKLLKQDDNIKVLLDNLLEFMRSDACMLSISALENVFHTFCNSQNITKRHIERVNKRMEELAPYVRTLLETAPTTSTV